MISQLFRFSIILASFCIFNQGYGAKDTFSINSFLSDKSSILMLSGPKNYEKKDTESGEKTGLMSVSDIFSYKLKQYYSDEQTISYEPSTSLPFGISVSYKGWGISHSMDLTESDEKKKLNEQRELLDQKEEINYQSTIVRYYKSWWGLEYFYSKIQGFVLQEASGLTIDKSKDTSIYRPDIWLTNHGINFIGFFSPGSISLETALDDTVPLTKSGRSFYGMISLDVLSLGAKSPLFPSDAQETFGKDGTLKKGIFYSVGPLIGYLDTIAYKSLQYIYGGGAGFSFVNYNYHTADDNPKSNGGGLKLNLYAGMKYGKKFNVGLKGIFDGPAFQLQEITVGYIRFELKFFLSASF